MLTGKAIVIAVCYSWARTRSWDLCVCGPEYDLAKVSSGEPSCNLAVLIAPVVIESPVIASIESMRGIDGWRALVVLIVSVTCYSPAAIANGSVPRSITEMTLWSSGLMRVTSPSLGLATHRLPA